MKELIEADASSNVNEISEHSFPGDNTSISDMESELQTDQSVQGSPFDHSAGNKRFLSLFDRFSFHLFYLSLIFLLF